MADEAARALPVLQLTPAAHFLDRVGQTLALPVVRMSDPPEWRSRTDRGEQVKRRTGLPPLRTRLGAAALELLPRSFRRAARILSGQSARNVFAGARLSRLELDWIASCIAADEEIKRDARRLRARARELSRNDPLVKHYLRLLGVNVIGPRGFKHQAQVRDNSGDLNKRMNDRIEEGFRDWSYRVTLDRKLPLVRFEHQLIRTVATDGEVFLRKWRGPEFPYGLALEPIDADLVDENLNVVAGRNQNEIRMGVEVDPLSRPVAYHVWNRPEGLYVPRARQRIPADQIIHLYDPDRVNQTRGVTWLHAVMLPLRFLDGYVEGELIASRVAANKIAIWQRKEGASDPTLDAATQTAAPLEETNPGSSFFAPEGYELANWDPQHPTAQFGDFVKSCERRIATGLGVSYEALTTDLADATYSSMKAGRQNERDVWRSMQEWWIGAFRREIYGEWMTQALLMGAAGADAGLVLDARPIAKLKAADWTGRGWLSPDPLKDMNAAVLGIENGIYSRHDYLAEAGEDWEETLENLQTEATDAEAAGVSISSAQAKAAAANALADANAADAADQANRNQRLNGRNGNADRNAVLTGAD